jgi:hypothetical protein
MQRELEQLIPACGQIQNCVLTAEIRLGLALNAHPLEDQNKYGVGRLLARRLRFSHW